MGTAAHFLDEDIARRAHERVAEQYSLSEADGDRYWRLKSAIYRSMGGRFEKGMSAIAGASRQIRQGMPPMPNKPPSDPIGRRIRHAVSHHNRGGVDLHKAEAPPAQLAGQVFGRDPHPLGPPPARNRAEFPYKGTLDFQGLKIRVENPAGSVRRGTDGDGKVWETRMRVHYGEFERTRGVDGDPVDAFVGPGRFEPYAYVVHTQDPGTRKYDEDKVMLGFKSNAEALAVFRAHYTGRGFVQSVRRLTIGELRAWLADPANRGRKINGGDVLAKAETFLARVRRSGVS